MIWRERRVSDMADLINGFPFESSAFADEGVPLVRIRDIQAEPFQTFLPEEVVPDSAYVRDGDVVIGMDGDFNTVYWLRGAAALNQRLCLLRENGQADTRFLAYALPTHLKTINDLTYATTVKHLSSGQVRAIKLMVPPLGEQRAIADYLDRETARIDTLIAEQQRLIETLRERRLAAISQAVTRGLEPDIETKDSGVEWLGQIPRHWQVLPIKRVVHSTGVGLVINPSTYVAESGVPFLLGRNVRDGWIDLTDVNYMSEENSIRLRASRLRAGDVVIMRVGYPGRAAVITPELDGANCASIIILRQPTLTLSELVSAFFNSSVGRTQVELSQYGAAQDAINLGDVVNFVMPVPPMSEQVEIVHQIAARAASIDALIAETETFIELSRERRSALITAAVTGQIDVGEVA